jgi:hypothetical protein
LQALSGKTKPVHKQDDVMSQPIYRLERVAGVFSLFLLNSTLGGVTEQHKVAVTNRTLTSLFHESVTNVLGPLWDGLSKISDNKVILTDLKLIAVKGCSYMSFKW